jgi:acetate kinase
MPPKAYRYPLPEAWYREHQVRRYGFHGTSHAWVARRAAELLDRPLEALNLITLHLGNGASAAAIAAGRSLDTSMGLTPLEGLMMGTRSGDIDPAIPNFVGNTLGLSNEAVDRALNRNSGLKGICGVNDMREVLARAGSGDPNACLARDMYCYRAKKYIGAYCAVLGRLDALVFTAGIGEHSPDIRAGICAGLEGMGIRLDEERNGQRLKHARAIHRDDSRVAVLVIPTDEELEIARQTRAVIEAG